MSKDVMIGFFFTGKNLDLIASTQMAFSLKAMGIAKTYEGNIPTKALNPSLDGEL